MFVEILADGSEGIIQSIDVGIMKDEVGRSGGAFEAAEVFRANFVFGLEILGHEKSSFGFFERHMERRTLWGLGHVKHADIRGIENRDQGIPRAPLRMNVAANQEFQLAARLIVVDILVAVLETDSGPLALPGFQLYGLDPDE